MQLRQFILLYINSYLLNTSGIFTWCMRTGQRKYWAPSSHYELELFQRGVLPIIIDPGHPKIRRFLTKPKKTDTRCVKTVSFSLGKMSMFPMTC